MVLCATWSDACKDSLKLIQSQSGRLRAEEITALAVFVEEIKPKKLKQWLDQLGVSHGVNLKVIIDRYHRSAIRLGAYEGRVEARPRPESAETSGAESQEKEPIRESVKRIRVPLGVILSTSGRVLSIVSQEGADLIDHISKVIRYSGE